MIESQRIGVSAHLTAQFLKNERLQELAQQGSIDCQRRGVKSKQRAGKPGIPDVQFRGLYEPAEAVALPGQQPFQEEHLLAHGQIIADRDTAELEGRGQI